MVIEQATQARLNIDVFQALFDRCSNWGRWGPDDERGTLNLITPLPTVLGSTTSHGMSPLERRPPRPKPCGNIASSMRPGDRVSQLD